MDIAGILDTRHLLEDNQIFLHTLISKHSLISYHRILNSLRALLSLPRHYPPEIRKDYQPILHTGYHLQHSLKHTRIATMKFLTVAALATSVAAIPTWRTRYSNRTITDNTPFALLAIRSGNELQYSPFSASQGSLVLNDPSAKDAVCATTTTSGAATFYLSNGALYLYTPANITQELYTDRSGMGQGMLQYSTTPGGSLPGRNSETTGWMFDAVNDIVFSSNSSFVACPAALNATSGPYSVWLNTGVTNPGSNLNCVGIAARAVPVAKRNACTYSYTPKTSS